MSQDDDEKLGEVHPMSEPSYIMLSTNHCVMSTSPAIWVLFEGYKNHHQVESVDVNDNVLSLVKNVIKVLFSDNEKSVLPVNVNVYYQKPDTKSKTTVETLAGHWQKLSELIKPGQQAAFFRMEIQTVSPLIGKLFHTFYFMCFFVNDFSFLSFLQRQRKLAS